MSFNQRFHLFIRQQIVVLTSYPANVKVNANVDDYLLRTVIIMVIVIDLTEHFVCI